MLVLCYNPSVSNFFPFLEDFDEILSSIPGKNQITVKPLNDGKLSSHEKIPSLRGFRL